MTYVMAVFEDIFLDNIKISHEGRTVWYIFFLKKFHALKFEFQALL